MIAPHPPTAMATSFPPISVLRTGWKNPTAPNTRSAIPTYWTPWNEDRAAVISLAVSFQDPPTCWFTAVFDLFMVLVPAGIGSRMVTDRPSGYEVVVSLTVSIGAITSSWYSYFTSWDDEELGLSGWVIVEAGIPVKPSLGGFISPLNDFVGMGDTDAPPPFCAFIGEKHEQRARVSATAMIRLILTLFVVLLRLAWL